MLVLAGWPVELDAHIERLSASVAALYDRALPSEARATAAAHAREVEHGKLRLTVVPADGRLQLGVAASEVDARDVFPAIDRGAALRSVVVEGGLGEHKWADRRLLDGATAAALPGELPLLLEGDGTVLEASRGSVFAIRGERLATPPTDGRILPSIARRQAIEVAAGQGIETSEERLTLADLRAGEVFLTGSVRGVEPVKELDGVPLPPPGKLSERIAAGLKNRWLPAAAVEPAAAVAAGRQAGLRAR
jgi:para-aminobenzoate synthetase / 4-amino-4-deoxychorismate lyase